MAPLTVAALVVASLAVPASGATAAATPVVAPAGASRFVSVPPARVLDTRVGVGARAGRPAPGASVRLQVTGAGGVPASGVAAVVMNVVVTNPARVGYVQVLPSGGGTLGASSNLNVYYPGQTSANLVTVPVGADGAVTLYDVAGGDLVADVLGFFEATSASRDGRYVGLNPTRILDSRDGTGTGGSTAMPAGGSTLDLKLTGSGGVPASGVSAVAMTVTATQSRAAGFVQVVPTGGPTALGTTSNVNLTGAGQTVANLVIVPVGTGGSVQLYNSSGTHLIVDVVGYFTDTTAPTSDLGLFVPVAPARLMDTRTGGGSVAAGSSTALAPSGRASIPTDGVAAVFVNATVTDTAGAGFVQLFPAGHGTPGASSSLNFTGAGQTIANANIATLGDEGVVSIYTPTGTQVIVDAFGFFTGAPPSEPTGLVATSGDGQVALSWGEVSTPGLAGYAVYQATGQSGPFTRLPGGPIVGTAKTITGLANGTPYWFAVTSVSTTGQESARSPSVPGMALEPAVTVLGTAAGGAVVESGGFTATVAPGVITEPGGAAVTVTPLPFTDGVLPAVDVHIDGAWDPGATGVQVSGPWPFATEPTMSPIVLHDAADGLRITSGDAVALSTAGAQPTVTFSVDSLSEMSLGGVVCSANPLLRNLQIGCTTLTDLKVGTVWDAVAFRTRQAAAALVKNQPPCSAVGNMAAVGNVIGGRMTCSVADNSGTATYTFTNTSDANLAGWSLPIVIGRQTTGAPLSSQTEDNQNVSWLFGGLGGLGKLGGDGYILPGGALTLTKTTTPRETTVSWQIDRNGTMGAALLQFMASQIGASALRSGDVGGLLVSKMAGCGKENTQSLALDCFRDVMVDAAKELAKTATGTAASAVASKILFALDSTVTIAAFAQAFDATTYPTHLINSTPTDPPTDRGGDVWIGRNPDNGRAVLVTGSTTADILDTATFTCLAKRVAVWDIPDLRVLRNPTTTPAECTGSATTPWTYTPTSQGGNTGVDIILRNPDGAAWLINTDEQIQPIPDHGTYLLLARSNPVIWDTASDKIGGWNINPTACGMNGLGGTGGTVCAWGDNWASQLGATTTIRYSSKPMPVDADTHWAQVSAGDAHTVAIKADGTLWAWGFNGLGQLGDGTTTDQESPVNVGSGTPWGQVSAGGNYTAAIKTDGTLWAWGANGAGQLGDGTTTDRVSPLQIGTGKWAQVSAGGAHTVAVKTDGTLWAWGDNNHGEVGDGTTTNQHSPVQVGTDTDWAQASGGGKHTLAVKTDGTLWAWGLNTYGELGDGTTTNRSIPVKVGTDTHWAHVSAGEYHTVALKTDGTVWAWGYNYYGDEGPGGITTTQLSPVQVGTDTDWAQVAAGGFHTVALKTDGTLWAWGDNSHAQLGDGSLTGDDQLSPVQVGSDTHWAQVAAGWMHTVALRS